MDDIKLSKEQTEVLVSKVKEYFEQELEQDIGSFEAEFLIDFFIKNVGPVIYNRGLADAQQLFSEKADEISYQIQELEKPIY